MRETTFQGVPCKRGHSGLRYVTSRTCVTCTNEAAKEWRLSKPDQFKSLQRKSQLRRKYGITPEQRNTILDSQGFACAICHGALDEGRATHVDHCHTTGAVRGILCSPCNTAIGLLKEDPEVLRRAVEYLAQKC